MFDDFKDDIDRYTFMGEHSWFYYLLTEQGLWALAEYRFSRWVRNKVKVPLITHFLILFDFVWHKVVQILTGIDIHKNAEIGKGLYIGHFSCIFVGGGVKLGEYCNISQGVTLGIAGRGDRRGSPIIGDRVYIAAGAKVIGKVTIGNDVTVGVNAVVTKDLPNSAVAVGIPAHVINYDGSQEFILYRGRQ